jgi:hypothetical protein
MACESKNKISSKIVHAGVAGTIRELFEKKIFKSTNILMGLSCGATLFFVVA